MERTGADAPPHNCPQPATKNRKTVFKFYLLKGQPLYDFLRMVMPVGCQKLHPLIRNRPDWPNRPSKMVINDAKRSNHNTPQMVVWRPVCFGDAGRAACICPEKIPPGAHPIYCVFGPTRCDLRHGCGNMGHLAG